MRSHCLAERGRAAELGARARRRADRHRDIAQIARVRRRAASCRRRPTAAHGSVGRSVPTICTARWPSSMRWSGCGALAVLQWLLLDNLATQSPGDPSLPRFDHFLPCRRARRPAAPCPRSPRARRSRTLSCRRARRRRRGGRAPSRRRWSRYRSGCSRAAAPTRCAGLFARTSQKAALKESKSRCAAASARR